MRLFIFTLLLVISSTTLAYDVTLDGPAIQGGLIIGRTQPNTIVQFNDRPVRVSKQGVFLIGFDRDEPEQTKLTITYPDGKKELRQLNIKKRQYKIQRINNLKKKFVNPPKKYWDRINSEAAQARAARTRDDARTDFLTGFIWPARGRISGIYGSQRILNGEPKRPHYGVDVAAPANTPIIAPAPGLVTLVHNNMYYSGGTLTIDHGHGLSSTFLHLSDITVKEGQHVTQGELIGKMGATGRVTGVHLDWRMNLFKRQIDPQLLVKGKPEPAKKLVEQK